MTYDFSPFNLTTWGYAEATRNVNNAAWGGVLGRLITRGLPQHYNATSVYTHFPFITPTGQHYSMDNIMKKLGLYQEYTFDKPDKQGDVRVIIDPKVLENVLGGGDPRDSHGLESLSASLLSGGLQRKLRTISLESFRALLSYLKVS